MRLVQLRHILAAVLLSAYISAPAQAAETPSTLEGVTIISTEEVTKLQSAGTPVIDVRVASEYAEEHVKGAASIPYREKSEKSATFDPKQDEFNVGKLPENKANALIFYCNGPSCWKSYKASKLATQAGYAKIYWYRDGFNAWKEKKLPTE